MRAAGGAPEDVTIVSKQTRYALRPEPMGPCREKFLELPSAEVM
jgi:hypothetical protein